jgi:hypothetical protein
MDILLSILIGMIYVRIWDCCWEIKNLKEDGR